MVLLNWSEISSSAKEQALGVEQINNAIAQLNDVTQRNVVNSDQIKLAADGLFDISRKLEDSIEVFKIE